MKFVVRKKQLWI